MRADRLVSLVLLLRQRGQLPAATLATELEVSVRTVLRDIEALSTAGVPIHSERGRHGGYALLPGFRTELTGLNHDEALALLVAGSRRGAQSLGLGSALASAMLKVVDALPSGHVDTAITVAERLLIDPQTDLLARPLAGDEVSEPVMLAVRRAVLEGRRLRIRYPATESEAKWRTVDPLGLVTVRDRGYLLATHEGADRTYRLSRVVAAELLDEPAQRSDRIDLERAWVERSHRFRTGGDQLAVLARVTPSRLEQLRNTAVSIDDPGDLDPTDPVARYRLVITFQDFRHALWAMWECGTEAEVLAPQELRAALRERAHAVAECYRLDDNDPSVGNRTEQESNPARPSGESEPD